MYPFGTCWRTKFMAIHWKGSVLNFTGSCCVLLARNIPKEYSCYVHDVDVEVLPSRQPAFVSIHERDMTYLALTAMGPKPALHVIVITCSTVSIRPPQGRSGRSRVDGPMHLLGVVKRDYRPLGTVSVPPCSWGPLTCARTQPCTGRTSVL